MRTDTNDGEGGAPREVLTAAAGAARYAPSIHNTQPWRWTRRGESLRLSGDEEKRLSVSDSDGRMAMVSCGAALAYASAAVAAQGWRPVVDRFPDVADATTLAEVSSVEALTDDGAAARRFQAMMRRRTDRRPLRPTPVDDATLDTLAEAANAHDVHLHVVRGSQMIDLIVAAERARTIDRLDAARARETREWTDLDDESTTGVPAAAVPMETERYRVPPRFGRTASPGSEIPGPLADEGATYAVLYTDEDDRLAWLRTGEALADVWTVAVEAGLALVPLSSVVELAWPRVRLDRILAGIGHAQLVVRVGFVEDAGDPPPMTKRGFTSGTGSDE